MDANATILIVDSDAKSQKMLEVTFKKAGHSVILTSSLEEARAQLEQTDPAIVLVEVSLPDGSGFDLYDELRQMSDAPSIIFLGPKDAVEDKVRAIQMGADDFLMKPIFVTEMTSRVDALLQRRLRDQMDAAGDEVTGDLKEVTIIDLLQMIESSARSGSLHVERDSIKADVFFLNGDIIDALCPPLKGEEALYRLMLWPKGHFTLRYHEVPEQMDMIAPQSQELLLEGMKRFDRWNQMLVTLPHLGKTFEADYQRMATVLEGSPQEVGQILRLFDGYRTMRQVVDQSPLDDITTLRVIRKLLDDDLLKDITPDEAELRETAQHTNLASWLAGKQIRSATREEASRLFDTSPGVKSVPGLNNDESGDVDKDDAIITEEGIAKVAASVEKTEDAGSVDEIEEGQAPDLSAQKISQWRFHWDKESNQAVAAPRTQGSQADPFALDSLNKDLELLEQRRREEEARRLEADRQRLEEASKAAQSTQPEAILEAQQPEATPEQEDEEYVKKDSTQELHRQAVLDEVDKRERTPTPHAMPVQGADEEDGTSPLEDPTAGIEDMIERAERQRAVVDEAETLSQQANDTVREQANSLSDKVSTDFEATSPEEEGRVSTDQFEPVSRELLAKSSRPTKEPDAEPEEVDTLEIPRGQEEENLVPLGAEISEEPVVSEEDLEELRDAAKEEPGDKEIESQEESSSEVLSHRTAHNKEFVHVEYDLQKGTPVSEDEVAQINEVNEAAKEADAVAAASTLDFEAPELDESDAEDSKPEAEAAQEDPPEEEVKAAPALEDPKEEEEEIYATEVPLFADEKKEGFNLPGLLTIALVILAVLFIFVFMNQDDSNKKPTNTATTAVATSTTKAKETSTTNTTVASTTTETTTTVALNANTPDAGATEGADAGGADAGTSDAGTALAGLDEEAAPKVAAEVGQTVQNNASVAMITALGKDPKGVEDPVAFLAALPQETTPPDTPEAGTPSKEQVLKDVEKSLAKERFKKAKGQIAPLVKENPNDGRVAGLYGRSLVYSNSGKAISEMNRAMGLGYKTPEMYIDLGTAYFMRGNKSKAKTTYKTFLNLYPKHPRAREIRSIIKNQ